MAGCDEAGRGPLAGPVVAAAVVLDPKRIPKGIDDSKRLTAERREELFEEICATASFAVAFASPARIDRDNILRASLWALARAVHALPEMPNMYSSTAATGSIALRLRCRDRRRRAGAVDAAASIIAKVSRDRLMCKLAQDCPGYGSSSTRATACRSIWRRCTGWDHVHHRRFFAPVVGGAGKTPGMTDRTPASSRRETQIEVEISAAV